MEDNMLYSLISCMVFLVLSINLLLQRRKQQKINLPPSPFALPVIGHLHLLKQPVHRTLHSLSQNYGPIFSLKFGSRLAVIVSSPSAVEECFTKNDIVLTNRPLFLASRYLTYNGTTMGTAPYGDHWRNLRRVSAIEIFSSSRLNSFLGIRREEVKRLLRRLHRVSSHGFAKVELRSMLLNLTSNIILRMIAGKRYYGEDVGEIEEARMFREIMEEFFESIGMINVGDFIPFLQWVTFSGYVRKLEALRKKMDRFLQGLIDEHRDNKERNTMINHFLTLQESEPEYYTDEIIKGHVLLMLLGGTDTTATAMEWTLANLFNHPEVLKKVKKELDTQVGQDHLIDEPDFSGLHYLQRNISESLRLYPVSPLVAPRMPSIDCKIGGYDVPAGTILFVNAWAIQRDPTLWDDPTNFKPERFEINNEGRIEGYKFLAFGMGRRSCPGDGLAKRVMTLTLGSLIQCFEWERVGENKIDMNEKTGLTMCKVKPLEVMCKARPNLDMFLS